MHGFCIGPLTKKVPCNFYGKVSDGIKWEYHGALIYLMVWYHSICMARHRIS